MTAGSAQPSSPTIAVVGLGRMGLPIAGRLSAAGYVVVGVDTSTEQAARAEAIGIATSRDGRAAVGAAGVVITVLPGPQELESAMTGADGLASAMNPGSCWLDLTSNDPRVATRVAAGLRGRGIAAIAAPMGGGPSEAAAGSLRFFVGGAEPDIRTVRPLLRRLAADDDAIQVVGTSVADGHTAKLLANLLWFGQVVAVSEAMLLAQRLGLEPSVLHGPLAASAGGSGFLDRHFGALLRDDYLVEFGIDRCVEELRTVRSLAEEAGAAETGTAETGVPFELSALVTRVHEEALARFGPVGGELLAAKLLEERAGSRIR